MHSKRRKPLFYYLQGRSVCRLCREHTSGINQGYALYHSCMDTLTGGCLKQCNAYRGRIDTPKADEASSQMNNQYQTFRLTGNELCQK